MSREEIFKKVSELLYKSRLGVEVESPKIDFKRTWYNLREKHGISEFLKDTTAMVNTVGLDGFIIIGWDDKHKEFHEAKFSDCGLSDTNEINGIIAKGCSDLFDLSIYDEKIHANLVSIIHIPPSFSKPVFVKNHQTFHRTGDLKNETPQRIFVRSGTSTQPASKPDIEMMYYDRKNIIQEDKIEIFCQAVIHLDSKAVGIQAVIQNYGTRPVAITNALIELWIEDNKHIILSNATIERVHKEFVNLGTASSIINPNYAMERVFVFPRKSGSIDLRTSIEDIRANCILNLRTAQGKLYKGDMKGLKIVGNDNSQSLPNML